uniref:transcription factor bHLH52-like n=1 Tax=Erigeron canadensis TaxID=72917 RepID=UPI001CB9356D|nr:transcription factor bHLH52-like [Erigeron canadensis]
MAALSFHSNWPTPSTFHRRNTAIVPPPPPPDFLPPFHDNYHHFSTFNNNAFTSNHLSFHNSTNFPTLSSSSFYNNNNDAFSPLTNLAQDQFYSNNPLFVPNNVFDHHQEILPMNIPMEYQTHPQYNSYDSYSSFFRDQDLCPMDQILQPELPQLPEIYNFGNVCNDIMGDNVKPKKENNNNGNGGKERISAQSMAARVRRRKISEKTSELGKLVPGGHKMTTAEMFQAAYKYIKFLQAQVGVLQLMSSSPELQAFITSPAVQEKLYTEEKCIVSQTLARTIADDAQIDW